MRPPIWVMCIVAAAAVVVAGFGLARGDKPAPQADPKEHDFGTKVLVVQSRVAQGEANSVILEKAKIRRLADQYFVVGSAPDMGPMFRLYNGAVIWTPLSDVTKIIEHDSLDKVKKIYNQQRVD